MADERPRVVRVCDYVFPRGAGVRHVSTWMVAQLDANGKVVDVWTYAPSALPDFDRSALEEVRGSAYAPAISRCGVVMSLYLLHVETGY